MDDEPSMSQFASKADYDAAADAAELKRLRAMFAAATEIQGDDEVLKYVTSGNAIPVTRCTVSADLIRQLVARSAIPHVNQLKQFACDVTGASAVVMGDSAIVQAYRAMINPSL
jgi:hypothetical protein